MKNFKYILFILFLININILANDSIWIRQETNTIKNLSNGFFVNEDTGWVVGQDGIILNTINGGDQWNVQTSGTNEYLMDVYFINSKVGYAVGFNGTILKTENSGSSWISQTSGTDVMILSVFFIHPDTGWISAEYGLIKYTVNGGISWAVQSTPVEQPLFAIQFINNKNGWAVGTGNVLHTTDGGDNWNIIPTNISGANWFDLSCIDENHIWIGSHNHGVYNTTNGGNSWDYKTIGTYLFFINQDTGWVSYAGDHIELRRTVDGGEHWEIYENIEGKPFFINENIGWLIDEIGIIYKTTCGGVTTLTLNNNQNNIQSRFHLSQNYPNPFKSSTIIKYNLPDAYFVTLKIYNVTGQEIKTLVNEYKTAGEYEVAWSAKGIPDGIYLYMLKTEKMIEIRKIIKRE